MSRHGNGCIGATHVQTNGRTSGCSQRGTSSFNSPSIFNVLVAETIEVSVQSNNATFASVQLRSIELQVATQLVNRELSRGLATILGSGHCIDTRNRSGQRILMRIKRRCVGIRITHRHSPSIGGTSDMGRHDRSGCILTNHIVTRNGNIGNRIHINSIVCRHSSGVDRTADRVSRSGGKCILAGLVKSHDDGSGVFTRNLHTIHVPIIETGISTSLDSCSCGDLIADTDIRTSRDIQSDFGRSNDMDNNAALILTTFSSGSFHIIGLIFSSSCGNRHHESGSTDSIVSLTGLFPSVGDILIGPAVEVSIQHNHVARANIVFRSSELHI